MSTDMHLLQSYETTIADSFVSKNKLRTTENNHKERPSSGEARLYLGGMGTEANDLFSFSSEIPYRSKKYLQSNENCYFLVSDLLKYLCLARNEYLNPTQNYFYDISKSYFEIIKELKSFHSEKLYFHVFHHPGEKDGVRFYINSLSPHWTLFRAIALPHITKVKIDKLLKEDSNEIEYYFKLKLNKKFYASDFLSDDEWFNAKVIKTIIRKDISTDRITQTLARRGQGLYRNLLLETMPICCFTGLADTVLLRASHIKPWRICDNNERLDPYNGLVLTPTYDVLFDKGLISFNDDGRLLISPYLSSSIIDSLILEEGTKYNIFNDHDHRSPYLEYHREHIFKY